MDDIRIQIVNYKTKAYLVTCLRSVFEDLKESDLKFSVAILDNDSGDDFSDMPRLFPGKSIEIKKNSKNVGFGAGHNILAKEAKARTLLLLNPDVKIIESRTIERLLDTMDSLECEVIGPRLVTAQGATQHWDHGELYGFRARWAAVFGRNFWRERREVGSVAWVSGAVFLMKKDSFDRLGGFDEKFFLYTEELDLCLRLRMARGRVIYDPAITVLHHGGVVAKKSDYQRASNRYFLEKHFRGTFRYPFLIFLNQLLN